MPLTDTLKRRWPWFLLGVPLTLAVLAYAGAFVYIHFIQADPPARLDFADTSSSTDDPTSSSTTVAADGSIEGSWAVTTGSQAGYRVNEVLFGQHTEAVGRTSSVEGSLTISDTTVSEAGFTVDLTTLKSDEDRRDNQFQGRIMNTSQFPEATFTLTTPIDFGTVPADQQEISQQVTGELTLRGTTKTVTFELRARRNSANIEINGSIPITFADYGIPEPSFGPATVEDHAEIEFLLVLSKV